MSSLLGPCCRNNGGTLSSFFYCSSVYLFYLVGLFSLFCLYVMPRWPIDMNELNRIELNWPTRLSKHGYRPDLVNI